MMRYVTQIVGAVVAWLVIFVLDRGGERVLFPNATSFRPLTLLEAAIVTAIALFAVIVIGRVGRLSLVIAPRLLGVVMILSFVQWLWLFRISPWWLASDGRMAFAARHPFLMLAIEIGVPSIVGGAIWAALMDSMTRRRRLAIVVASFIACTVTVFVMSPEIIRGTFESAGWIGLASPRHLSGAHTNPLPRNFAYVVVATVTGLIFYVTSHPAQSNRPSAG